MSHWILVLAPAAGLAADVLCQAAYFRAMRARGLLKSVFAGFGAGLAVTVFLTVGALCLHPSSVKDAAALILLNLLTFSALGYGYFNFVNLGETARRVRLLRELVEAGGTLTEEEILRRYNARDMVILRLDRLAANRQIVERSGGYVIGRPTVLYMSRLIIFMKRLLLGRCGEAEGLPR